MRPGPKPAFLDPRNGRWKAAQEFIRAVSGRTWRFSVDDKSSETMEETFYVWVCTICNDFRDYGDDRRPSDNPVAFLHCSECKKLTRHQQVDSEGNEVQRLPAKESFEG